MRGPIPSSPAKTPLISEATNGYWIFYEGPTYTKEDHAAYWKWFTWANKAIWKAALLSSTRTARPGNLVECSLWQGEPSTISFRPWERGDAEPS